MKIEMNDSRTRRTGIIPSPEKSISRRYTLEEVIHDILRAKSWLETMSRDQFCEGLSVSQKVRLINVLEAASAAMTAYAKIQKRRTTTTEDHAEEQVE